LKKDEVWGESGEVGKRVEDLYFRGAFVASWKLDDDIKN